MKISDIEKLGVKVAKEKYDDRIEIVVVGDVNNADYVTRTSELSLEDLEEVLPALRFLQKHLGEYNVPSCDNAEPEFEWDMDLWESLIYNDVSIPSDDYGHCHTIVSVDLYFYSKDDGVRYRIEI